MRASTVVALLVGAAAPLAGCSAIWGFQDVSLETGDAGGATDATAPSGDGAAADSNVPSGDGPAADSAGMDGGTTQDAAPQVLADNLATPEGLAVDSSYVFYSLLGTNTVVRMGKDGSSSIVAASASYSLQTFSIVSDGTTFYFSDHTSGSGANVYACPVAGCGSNATPLATGTEPLGVAVSGGTLYWAGNGDGSIDSVSATDGGGAAVLVNASGSSPDQIVVDGTNVYFTDNSTGPVHRVQTNGSGLTDITATNPPTLSLGIAAGTDAIFFAVASSSNGCDSIWSYSKTAQTLDTSFANNQSNCDGVATDATNVYWVNSGSDSAPTGSIMTCPQSGCPAAGPIQLAGGQNYPIHVAVDDSYVYWANYGTGVSANGSIVRMAKP